MKLKKTESYLYYSGKKLNEFKIKARITYLSGRGKPPHNILCTYTTELNELLPPELLKEKSSWQRVTITRL